MQIPRRPTSRLLPLEDMSKCPEQLSLRRAAIAAKDTQEMIAPKVSGPLHIAPQTRINPVTPVPPITISDDWLVAPAPTEPVVFKDSPYSTIDLLFSAMHLYISMHQRMPKEIVFGKAIRRLELSRNEYHLPGMDHTIAISYEPGGYDILVR